jgi:hypothetical protein
VKEHQVARFLLRQQQHQQQNRTADRAISTPRAAEQQTTDKTEFFSVFGIILFFLDAGQICQLKLTCLRGRLNDLRE